MTFIFLAILVVFAILIFIFASRAAEALFSPKPISEPQKPRVSTSAQESAQNNPVISKETKQAIATVRSKLQAGALPSCEAVIREASPDKPEQSRLGGPVYLPIGTDWPKSPNGKKLLFIAQINFAEIPSLPDFPETGLLQVFIADNDLFGADFDAPEKSVVTLLYHDALGEKAIRHENLTFPVVKADYSTETYTPFQSEAVQREGRVIQFANETGDMLPDFTHWKYETLADDIDDEGAVEALWDELALARPEHYIGGHINLTQSDFRHTAPYDEYDRILLQLGSDEHIMWGDMGEMSFSIRQEDLRNKRFENAIFWWDCC
jgi:uncharacterized protein YwqG